MNHFKQFLFVACIIASDGLSAEPVQGVFSYKLSRKEVRIYIDGKELTRIKAKRKEVFAADGYIVKGMENVQGARMMAAVTEFYGGDLLIFLGSLKVNKTTSDVESITFNVAGEYSKWPRGSLKKAEISRKNAPPKFYFYFVDGSQNLYENINGEGVQKDYYESGGLKSEMFRKNGEYEGMSKTYHEDGALHTQTLYLDGKAVEGTFRLYANGEALQNEIEEKRKAKALFSAEAKRYREAKDKPALPKEARRYAVRAEDATEEKDYPEAIKNYKWALQIAPWWPQGHYNQALLLGETTQWEDAILEMEAFLELEPDGPDSVEAQDQIYKWERKLGH